MPTCISLDRDGAKEMLQGLGTVPGLIDVINSALVAQAPERTKPM